VYEKPNAGKPPRPLSARALGGPKKKYGKDLLLVQGKQLAERLKVLRELFELDAGRTLDSMLLYLAGREHQRQQLWDALGRDPIKRDLATKYCALAQTELAKKGRR
jgi:hypothetical protein